MNVLLYMEGVPEVTVFFTSDLHFGHPFVAALRGYGKTDDAPDELRERSRQGDDIRKYVDWQQHDDDIVRNFNEVLTIEDELYILGDLSSGGKSSLQQALEMVNRFKVPRKRRHLILGNHDPLNGSNKNSLKNIMDCFASVSRNEVIVLDGRNVGLSHFQFRHHMDGGHTEDMSTNGRSEKYSKYAMMDDGSLLLLHGHTHAKTPFEFDNPREMNVGVDAWEMRPVSEETVMERLIHPNPLSR